MNRHRGHLLPLILLGIAAGLSGPLQALELEPEGPPIMSDMPRYGLNLGGTGSWGAEQLRANILSNPGFEPQLDRSLLIIGAKDHHTVRDNANWLARPNGFWSGGHYQLLSGRQAGREGTIADARTLASGETELWLTGGTEQLAQGDVLVMTQDQVAAPIAGWWYGPGNHASTGNETRPGSPGHHAMHLLATAQSPSELLHYVDNLADRAGKLRPLNGKWQLTLWAKGLPGSQLHLHFARSGQPPFLSETVTLTGDWQRYAMPFTPQDNGDAGVLTLSLRASGDEVWLDDAYLGEEQPHPSGFRSEVITTLQHLAPGFLRDWQGQLGDTLANRLAPEQGHRPVRYRPGEHEAQYHYSLPDFLALCAEVGADPWVVAPTTLNDQEWRDLGRYLHDAAEQYGFHTLLLEFGNENWNPLFRPAGLPEATQHLAVADRAFALLQQGSGQDSRILPVLNGQYANTAAIRELAQGSQYAKRIAVAPYFFYELNQGVSAAQGEQQALLVDGSPLHAQSQAVRASGKQLAVYEVNYHTTLGDGAPAIRNQIVTAAASGTGLARRLLQGTQAGIREQMVYSFSGFDSYVQEGGGLVHLWGITRDLATANRLRPTGLALGLLNQVARGQVRAARCRGTDCEAVTPLFFDDSRLAIASSSAHPLPIIVNVPCSPTGYQLTWLDGSDLAANNEQQVQVTLQQQLLSCEQNRVHFSLPPFSVATLRPRPPLEPGG